MYIGPQEQASTVESLTRAKTDMKRQNKGLIGNVAHQPKSFAVTFLVIFFVTYGFLGVVDALPEPSNNTVSEARGATTAVADVAAVPTVKALPVRIVVAKIGVDAKIANPQSTDLAVLDASLHDGAARYPTSAMLGEEGTMVLFGHSSYLPVVHSQTYKTFSGVQTLKNGEIISVYSSTHEYRYAVTGVKVADASQDVVELAQHGKELVLVTCDSFSKKTSRFVVSAKLVGTYSLTSN